MNVKMLVELAKEVETEDPIDWSGLSVSEDSAYSVAAISMLEMYQSLEPQDRDTMLLATAVKLVVENFALNLKLLSKND